MIPRTPPPSPAGAALADSLRGRVLGAVRRLEDGEAVGGTEWPLVTLDELPGVHRELVARRADVLGADPGPAPVDRYRRSVEAAGLSRALADTPAVAEHTAEALAAAREAGDDARVVAAATVPASPAPWQVRASGVVDGPTVDALRDVVTRHPARSATGCRARAALATELYYAEHALAEREVLAAQALDGARDLGDTPLLHVAVRAVLLATWRPATAPGRLAAVDELLAAPDADRSVLASARTYRCIVLSELGRVDEMWAELPLARALAEATDQPDLRLAVACVEAAWHLLSGRDAEAGERIAEAGRLAARIHLPQAERAYEGARLTGSIVHGDFLSVVAVLYALSVRSGVPLEASVTALLLRAGQEDAAREVYLDGGIDVQSEDWFTLAVCWAAAEVAVAFDDKHLARVVHDRCLPFAGYVAGAGFAAPQGPVDVVLALSAFAAGDVDLATEHATEAERLCRAWGLRRVAEFLDGLRARHGF